MADDKKLEAGKLGEKNKLETAGDGTPFETAEFGSASGSRAGLGKKIAVASAAVAAAGAVAAGIVAVKRRQAAPSSAFIGPEGQTASGLGHEAGVGVEENELVTV